LLPQDLIDVLPSTKRSVWELPYTKRGQYHGCGTVPYHNAVMVRTNEMRFTRTRSSKMRLETRRGTVRGTKKETYRTTIEVQTNGTTLRSVPYGPTTCLASEGRRRRGRKRRIFPPWLEEKCSHPWLEKGRIIISPLARLT